MKIEATHRESSKLLRKSCNCSSQLKYFSKNAREKKDKQLKFSEMISDKNVVEMKIILELL